jgi:YVTN family beta-propeller protein
VSQAIKNTELTQLFLAVFFLILAGACGVEESGAPPPQDALYNPLGLTAHPNGRYLLASNAVFDRKYNQSFISVIDTFEKKIIKGLNTEIDLFAGEIKLTNICQTEANQTTPCEDRIIGMVSSRDLNTLTSFELSEEDDRLAINCGQTKNSNRCGGIFVQHSGLLEKSSDAPYSIALDHRGAYLSHINTGAVSSWRLIDRPPFVQFGCQLQLPGANLLAQHPSTNSVLVSDRFGRSLFHAETLAQDDGQCQLRLLESSSVNSSALTNEHQGIAFSADGTRLYLVSGFDGALKVYATALQTDGSIFKQLIASIPIGLGGNIVRVAGVSEAEALPLHFSPEDSELERLGGGLIYVTSLDNGTVTVIDPVSLKEVSRIEVGRSPHDIVFMLNESGLLRGYVSLFEEHKIVIIDLHPDSETRFTKIGEIK